MSRRVRGLVLNVASEETGDAADGVGGALGERCRTGKCVGGIGGVADAVRKVEEGVDQTARVVTGGEQNVASSNFGRSEREGFGDGGARPSWLPDATMQRSAGVA